MVSQEQGMVTTVPAFTTSKLYLLGNQVEVQLQRSTSVSPILFFSPLGFA